MEKQKIILVAALFIFMIGSACFATDMLGGVIQNQTAELADKISDLPVEDIQLTAESVLQTPFEEALETQVAFGDLSAEQVQETVNAAIGMDLDEIKEKFYVPESAIYITSMGEMVNYQIMQPMVEVLDAFQIQFAREGLHFESELSEITELTSTLVYTGHSNGKTMIVQFVALNEGQTNVTIYYEE
jgi:hypothetical protein